MQGGPPAESNEGALRRAAGDCLSLALVDGELTLRFRWWGGRVATSALSAALGTGALAYYGFTFPPIVVLASLFAGVGWYCVLAYALNRTTIVADKTAIAVRHGPVPWPGNITVAVQDVAQIFVDEQITTSGKGTRSYDFTVKYKARAGFERDLVNGPLHPYAARSIEATLETFLGIQNQAVRGEFRPK
jgi:hypothetical protein